MRPGQNRRMRGRSRNKGPNPLTRSYESNGPDVKVRGTAQHVADKYAQLARDAQVSGDPVAAENYFQHAEHYYRLIATAQEALRQQYAGGPRAFDEDGDEGDEEGGANGYGYPGDRVQGVPPMDESEFAPQQQQPYDTPRGGHPDREQRYDRNDRQGQGQDRGPQQDRGPDRPQQDRGGPDRNQRFDRNGGGGGGGERFDRNANQQQRPDNNRFDNNRPANGRQDRNERFDRNDQRPRYPRNDQPRQENQRGDGNRSDGPRQDAPRPDYPRDDNSRGGEAPRRDYQRDPRDEAPDVPVAAALPAFLTNPVRTPIAFGEEPGGAGPAEANGEPADDFAAERPRRRARTRRPAPEGGPPAELAGEGETPAE